MMEQRYTTAHRPYLVRDTEGRTVEIPETWTIHNAPRPLAGSITWIGEFLKGIHYAAFNPRGADAERFTGINAGLDAAEVVCTDEQTVYDQGVAYLLAEYPNQETVIRDPDLRGWIIEAELDRRNYGLQMNL